jgi:hypothetical protein
VKSHLLVCGNKNALADKVKNALGDKFEIMKNEGRLVMELWNE